MSEWTVNNKLNEWYQKRYHIKLPKKWETKSEIYFSSGFSPSALFALAEPGVWYDPSDLTTLFTDPAGTTPVTAPGNTVGLMLDKSRGLALGPDTAVNGSFATDTGWTKDAGWTISSGKASTSGSVGYLYQNGSAAKVVGLVYKITFTVSDYVSGNVTPYISSVTPTGTPFNSNGDKTVYLRAINTSAEQGFAPPGAGSSFSIDNYVVRELAGNHATQATIAARPTYSIEPVGGRRNLLLQTEVFNEAIWVKTSATVTPNDITAPDGTMTADKVVFSGGTSEIYQAAGAGGTGALEAVGSIWVKGTAGETVQIYDAFTSRTPTTLTGNWQRLSVPVTGSTRYLDVSAANGATARTIWLWGAQLETGSTATNYQRVTTQYDVTEAGVASVGYLYFDGSGDFMVTSTITPGTDKVQIFAGVRKLSDATRAMMLEHSTSYGNAGTFGIESPTASAGNDYMFVSGGSVVAAASARGTGFVSPISNVVAGFGDIANDISTLRINGTQVAQSTANQGTGNYLAYPLYIGARSGTAIPFFGHLYSLITRFGANLDAPTIASTEAYVAGKTGFPNWANIVSPTIFARDDTAVLDRFNQIIERRA